MDFTLRRWFMIKAEVFVVVLVILSNFRPCLGAWNDRNTNTNTNTNTNDTNTNDTDSRSFADLVDNLVPSTVNIDKLLENYGKPSIRPDHESGNATQVRVSLRVTHLHSVEEINTEMVSTMVLYASWYDSRLLKESERYSSITNIVGDSIDKLWKPDLLFVNGKSASYDKVPTEGRTVKLIQEGNMKGIFYMIRLHLTSACPMSLELFPFDEQHCSVILSSTGYTTQDMELRWFNEDDDYGMKGVVLNARRLPQFRVSRDVETDEYTVPSEIDGRNVSYISTTFTFQRDPVYYFWSYYLPSALLVILSWVNFWIDIDATPARISLGTTLVLTVITLIYSARSHLPKIAYPTAITIWLDAQGIFVVLALIEYAISHQLNYQDKLEKQINKLKEFKRQKQEKKDKNAETKPSDDYKLDENDFYMSEYSKDLADNYDQDTHSGGGSFVSNVIRFIRRRFGRNRKKSCEVKDKDTDELPIGKYRWWALTCDRWARGVFPAVYFSLVAAYVLSYRVWELFLKELQHMQDED